MFVEAGEVGGLGDEEVAGKGCESSGEDWMVVGRIWGEIRGLRQARWKGGVGSGVGMMSEGMICAVRIHGGTGRIF